MTVVTPSRQPYAAPISRTTSVCSVIGTYGSGSLIFADSVNNTVPAITSTMERSAPVKPSERLGHNAAASGGLAMRRRALREPSRDARHGFAHVVGRARIGEADIPVPMQRIEVYTRRRR